MPKMNGRRKAAFFIGVIAGVPPIMLGAAEVYSRNANKGIITGLVSYVFIVGLSYYVAKSYDTGSRYSDPGDE